MDQLSTIKLKELQRLTDQVLHPDENSEYYYQDVWQSTHSRIAHYCNDLLCINGVTCEEEASICLALFMAYEVSPCLNERKMQQVIHRASDILPKLEVSPLKKQLLAYRSELFIKLSL